MFEAFRSRCESDRSWSARISRARARSSRRIRAPSRRGPARGRTSRTYVAEVIDGSSLTRDQVRLVRQEPGERVACQSDAVRARKARFSRRRDAPADQVLAGLPGPPGARRAEQVEHGVEPLLAVEPLVDDRGRLARRRHGRLGDRRRPRLLEERGCRVGERARRGRPAVRRTAAGSRSRDGHATRQRRRCEDLEVLVRPPAAPAPAPPEPLGPGPGRVLDGRANGAGLGGPSGRSPGRPSGSGSGRPGCSAARSNGSSSARFCRAACPVQPRRSPQGVEVDHAELGLVGAEPDQDVARVEVLVDEARVVQPGGQDAEGRGQLLPDPRPPRLGPARAAVLHELVERDRPGIAGVIR